MANIDNTGETVAKPLSDEDATTGNADQVQLTDEEALNWLRERGKKITISGAELGRQWGWNERRAQRKLDGWETDKLIKRRGKQIIVLGAAVAKKPDMLPDTSVTIITTPEILSPAPAQQGVHRSYVGAALRGWRALGRVGVGLVIAGIGTFIAYTSIRANAWFGHSLTPDPTAGDIYSNLSVGAELAACAIPTGIRFYRQNGERLSAAQGGVLMAVALVVVFFAAGGFAVTNINAGVEAKAERTTPRIEELKHEIESLDKTIISLTTSIGVPGADGVIHQGECAKRGPKCEGLEAQRNEANKDRKAANDKLEAERNNVKDDADPAAKALGISSTRLRLVQGGAMVALCLCSGLFISFGAGLIWPQG